MDKYYGAFGLIAEDDLNQSTGFDSVYEMQETAAVRGHAIRFLVQNKFLEYFYITE